MLTWPRRQQRYTFLHITQTYKIQRTQLSKQKTKNKTKSSHYIVHIWNSKKSYYYVLLQEQLVVRTSDNFNLKQAIETSALSLRPD